MKYGKNDSIIHIPIHTQQKWPHICEMSACGYVKPYCQNWLACLFWENAGPNCKGSAQARYWQGKAELLNM